MELDGVPVRACITYAAACDGRSVRTGHLTLKKEATRPPEMNSLQQQGRFDLFVQEFNNERPHEALQMKTPAQVYSASLRPYDGLPELSYPLHDREVLVTACGRICMHRKRVNVSTVMAGSSRTDSRASHSSR